MPVLLETPLASSLLPIAGVRIGVAEAGIRKANRKDLTVFLLDEGCAVGAVFTQNRYAAAPVQVCREHLAAGQPIRAMVINTGNANAGTGEPGLSEARQTCAAVAMALGLQHEQVLPFSTGVIMEPLPLDRLLAGLPSGIDRCSQRRVHERCPLAVGSRRHHDHRHLAQGGEPAGACGWQEGQCNGYRQRGRHDPAQHGHHARVSSPPTPVWRQR